MGKRIFELIVVDTPEQAARYEVITTEDYRQQAIFVGQDILGLHYRGKRPNKLTRLHRPLETASERVWERQCLLRALKTDLERREIERIRKESLN